MGLGAGVAALTGAQTVTAAGLLGLVVGSFLNVVIHRLPVMLRREWEAQCRELPSRELAAAGHEGRGAALPETARYDLWTPRSACPHCGRPIPASENIPLLSFLWLRGRCAACCAPISLRYPLVEALTAVLFAACAWRFGATPATLAALALTGALIALAFIDLDQMLLPDAIVLPALWLGLLVNQGGVFAPLPSAVAGAAAGYLALWLFFHGYRLLTGKEGMGHGDFKLFALFGAWLGWELLPLTILLASLAGSLVGGAAILFRGHDRQVPIPFGPFLCLAGWVGLMWGGELITAYFRFAGLN